MPEKNIENYEEMCLINDLTTYYFSQKCIYITLQ